MVWRSQRIDSTAKVPAILSNTIRHKARGNFLWARLAMDLAVQGLLSGNTVDDLLQQVELMPEGVQEMYKLTLDRLPQILKTEALILLYLIASASGTLELRKLFTGLSIAVHRAQLGGSVLPVEHDADNFSRITWILGSFVDVTVPPEKQGFKGCFSKRCCHIRCREDCQIYMINSYRSSSQVKLNHETLQAFLLQSPWLQDALPISLTKLYPNYFWLRAFAAELSACVLPNSILTHQYCTSVNQYILKIKAESVIPTRMADTLENELMSLFRFWPHWTPLLSYALDDFFEELKRATHHENKIHECYAEVVNSLAVVMHCALCHFQFTLGRGRRPGCYSSTNLRWTTEFVDPHCIETWSVFAAAKHGIPEAVIWHLKNGQALAEYGSPRIQLLLTEILYQYCVTSKGTPVGYKKLIHLLIARGARFDTRHLCNLICEDAQCTLVDQAELCELVVQHTSSNPVLGHSHWCTNRDQNLRNHYQHHWVSLQCRGDSIGRKRISALLKLVLHFDKLIPASVGESWCERPVPLLLRIIAERSFASDLSWPMNRMLKVIESLKAGPAVDPSSALEDALDHAKETEQSFRQSWLGFVGHYNEYCCNELSSIVELLDYVKTHSGA